MILPVMQSIALSCGSTTILIQKTSGVSVTGKNSETKQERKRSGTASAFTSTGLENPNLLK